MKKNTQNQVAGREAQGSSVQSVQLKIEIPEDIKAPKFARAYAVGFRAAYEKRWLSFVAPAYRWAIARGWADGDRARMEEADREAAEMLAEETATAHA